MRKQQFNDITEWQQKTFGKATPLSKIAHLAKELEELVSDLKSGNPNKRKEFADCFILLFGAAQSDGMSYDDICNAIDEKMVINKNRKWGEPDKDGVVNHVKDVPQVQVFKFIKGDYYYVIAAKYIEEASKLYKKEVDIHYDGAKSIPESEFDEKTIVVYENNDTSKKYFLVSIRDLIAGTEPQLLYTNDRSLID